MQIDSTYDKKNSHWDFKVYSSFEVKIKLEAKCGDKILLSRQFDNNEYYRIGGVYQKRCESGSRF